MGGRRPSSGLLPRHLTRNYLTRATPRRPLVRFAANSIPPSFLSIDLLAEFVPAIVEELLEFLARTYFQMIPNSTDHHFPGQTGLA